MNDSVSLTELPGPGFRCKEASILHPVKVDLMSPTMNDAFVFDRHCDGSSLFSMFVTQLPTMVVGR